MQRPPLILPPTPGPIATDALARALLALARAVADRSPVHPGDQFAVAGAAPLQRVTFERGARNRVTGMTLALVGASDLAVAADGMLTKKSAHSASATLDKLEAATRAGQLDQAQVDKSVLRVAAMKGPGAKCVK